MRFIKYFKLFLEKFTDNSNIGSWSIIYNHTASHDINYKIINRTNAKNENQFNEILNNMVNKIQDNKLVGDYTFISFKYSMKLIVNISNNKIKIITILGKNENSKEDDIIIII